MKFFDTVKLTPSIVDPTKRKLFQTKDSNSPTGYALDVLINATFAGVFTANRAFYLPDRVSRGVESWLKPYAKPHLVHHDEHQDAIGRVQAARYIDTSASFQDGFAGLPHLLDSSNTEETLRVLRQFKDWAEKPDYQGLGHIRIHSRVTDGDAIEKILDGRYTTVSTSFSSPDGALCSICGKNFKVDFCEHEPGAVYDGERCWIIPLSFDYDELSYVNTPAIPQATNFAIGTGFGDAKRILNVQSDKDAKIFCVVADMYVRGQRYLSSVTDSRNINILDCNSQVDDITMLLREVEVKPIPSKDETKDSVGDKEMLKKLQEVITDTMTNYALISEHLEATKVLDKETLEKLALTDFLGPNKTFPVPNLEHVEACKKVLDTLEDKESRAVKLIVTWLDQKAEKLKIVPVVEEKKDNAEVKTETVIKGQMTEPTVEEKLVKVSADLADALAELELYKTRATGLQDEVDSLTKRNFEVVQDSKVLLVDSIVDLKSVGQKIEDREVLVKEYLTRTTDSLKDSLKDLRTSTKVAVKDGTVREPVEGKVTDPTVTKPEEKKVEVDLTQYKDAYARLISQYGDAKTFKGDKAAKRLAKTWKNQGLVPEDLDFETLLQ